MFGIRAMLEPQWSRDHWTIAVFFGVVDGIASGLLILMWHALIVYSNAQS